MFKGIQVFYLAAGTKGLGTFGSDRYIGIAPEAAFFHISVADIQVSEDGTEMAKIRPGLFRGADIRFAHDFDERNSGSVEIDPTVWSIRIMDQLSGIFFHMDPGDADPLSAMVDIDMDESVPVSYTHLTLPTILLV